MSGCFLRGPNRRPVRLRAELAPSGTDALEPAESALLDLWLQRITGEG